MSFVQLVLAEAARLRYRPRARLSLLAVLILGLFGPPLWMWGSRPVSADEYAAAAAEYELIRESCDCTIESLLRESDTMHHVVYLGIGPWLLLVAVFVLFVMIVYAASDFASGAITTQLTFTPNRLRLLTARTLVSGAFGVLLMGVCAVVSTVVSIVWFVAVNGYASLPPESGLLQALVGSLLLGAFVAMLATLLVFLFQGGLIGGSLVTVVLLSALLLEALAYDLALPHWLYQLIPTRQAEALVVGFAYPQYEQAPLNAAEALTTGGALLYFTVLVGIVAAAAAFSFHRRDIKN